MRLEGFDDLSLVGRGGFSRVYRAHQTEFDRLVALKLLHVEVETDESRRVFVRECVLSGRLTGHPNIVTVFGSGFAEETGEPYIVMEYAPGGSVARQISERGHLEVAEALWIAIQIAGALESAHRCGVIHRDVKPQNVVFQRSGAPGLTDFGIAAVAGFAPTSMSAQALTPLHAAPELFRGEPSSAASDTYGLGSTLFTMLQGTPPFGTSGEMPFAVLARVLQAPVPAITSQEIPEELQAVVDSLLAKSPEDRPMLVEVIAELQRIESRLDSGPTAVVVFDQADDVVATVGEGGDSDVSSAARSSAATSWDRFRRDRRRRTTTTAALTALVVALLAALAGGGWYLTRDTIPRDPNIGHAHGIQEIAATDTRVCAIVPGGTVKCWGQNDQGQLGDGTADSSTTPVPVIGLDHVVQLAVTGSHACALIADGTVKCWGSNERGALGDGTTTDRHVPVAASGVVDVRQISVGWDFTCALLTDGRVQCWGWNGNGQLGSGTIEQKPRLTPGPVVELSEVAALASRDWSTCALLGNGTAKCWGGNSFGALGNGTTKDSGTPVTVKGLSDAVDLAAGYFHACAVMGDGSAMCWGQNDSGQLGDGTTTTRLAPVAVKGLDNVRHLALGEAHTCGLLDSGQVMCWGANKDHQVGPGPARILTPTLEKGLPLVRQIAAGNFSTCAGTTTSLRCWGKNENGQLGDGTTTDRTAPVQVKLG